MRHELYRLVGDQVQQYAGQAIVIDRMVHSKPDDDMLRRAGYLPIIAADLPEFDPETQWVKVDHYTLSENGDEIIAHYVVADDSPIIETKEPTMEERVAALEQAGFERDMALIELAAMLAEGGL